MAEVILVADSKKSRRERVLRTIDNCKQSKKIPDYLVIEAISYEDALKNCRYAKALFVGDYLRSEKSPGPMTTSDYYALALINEYGIGREHAISIFYHRGGLAEKNSTSFRDIPDKYLDESRICLEIQQGVVPFYYLEVQVKFNEDGQIDLYVNHKEVTEHPGEGGKRLIGKVPILAKDCEDLHRDFVEWKKSDWKDNFSEARDIFNTFVNSVESRLTRFRELVFREIRSYNYIVFTGCRKMLEYPFDLIRRVPGTGRSFLSDNLPVYWTVTEDVDIFKPIATKEGGRQLLVLGYGEKGSVFLNGSRFTYKDLPHINHEIGDISAKGRSSSVTVELLCNDDATRANLDKQIPKYDYSNSNKQLFHYCGHGFQAEYIDAPKISADHSGVLLRKGSVAGEGHALSVTELISLLRSGNMKPRFRLIFLNCCEIAAAPTTLNLRHSFYRNVLDGLIENPIAKNFICHRWRVGDCLARHFAIRFYERFFDEKDLLYEVFNMAQKDIGINRSSSLSHERCQSRDCRYRANGLPGGSDETTWLAPVLVMLENPWKALYDA